MKILDRYILLTAARNLGFAVIALVLLFLTQALSSDLFNHEFPARQIIYYHLLNVPQIAVKMAPPAVLLATVVTLAGLSRTQELVACFALGVTLKRITTLLLAMAAAVSCLILLMEDRLLPPLHRARTAYHWREMRKRPDFFLDIRMDRVWYRSKNVIYNLQRFDSSSDTIHGMTVYTFDDQFNLVQVVGAERARYTPHGWRLLQGTVTVFSQENAFPLAQEFKEKELIIQETPTDFREIDREIDGLRFHELSRYIARLREAGTDARLLEVTYHARLSLSFIPMVMCLLAVPFSLSGRREGGLARDLQVCLLVTFFYWLFYSVGLSLGANGALPPWLAAWLPSAIFVVWAATLIARRK